jgi:hypothetical protein
MNLSGVSFSDASTFSNKREKLPEGSVSETFRLRNSKCMSPSVNPSITSWSSTVCIDLVKDSLDVCKASADNASVSLSEPCARPEQLVSTLVPSTSTSFFLKSRLAAINPELPSCLKMNDFQNLRLCGTSKNKSFHLSGPFLIASGYLMKA